MLRKPYDKRLLDALYSPLGTNRSLPINDPRDTQSHGDPQSHVCNDHTCDVVHVKHKPLTKGHVFYSIVPRGT